MGKGEGNREAEKKEGKKKVREGGKNWRERRKTDG